MRFRELRIEASPAASDHGVLPSGIAFRWTAHHVREIFSAVLPRDTTLDGSSVIQITCGPRVAGPLYHRALGSSEYFVEDFDFAHYARASPRDREVLLLQVIETALHDIARLVGAEPTPIEVAAQRVRDCSFALTQEVARLKRKIPNSPCAIRVFRSLSNELGESWLMRVCPPTGAAIEEVVMGKSPSYLDRREFYRAAEIEGANYIVRDTRGRETFRFDIVHLLSDGSLTRQSSGRH